MGYAPNGYRLQNPDKRKIIIGRDVKFKMTISAENKKKSDKIAVAAGDEIEEDENVMSKEEDEEDNNGYEQREQSEYEDADEEENQTREEDMQIIETPKKSERKKNL